MNAHPSRRSSHRHPAQRGTCTYATPRGGATHPSQCSAHARASQHSMHAWPARRGGGRRGRMGAAWRGWVAVAVAAAAVASAAGQIIVPGADGSDGVFAPTGDVQIDLSQAPTGAWDGPNASPGNGVYDPNKWAVVFRYSSVNIPPGVTVTFKNHPSRAPVVWLVSGDVTIGGVVSVVGQSANRIQHGDETEPGPGGFRGGRRPGGVAPGSAGYGPGGGVYQCGGGSYGGAGFGNAGPTYGNDRIIPLIGGSGGAGCSGSGGRGPGGGGGGAILIAASGSITLDGTITANGGIITGGAGGGLAGRGGSGGAIRLVADSIGGGGALRAVGLEPVHPQYSGGVGRIRLEANSVTLADVGDPPYTTGLPGATAQIWPDQTAPSVRIVSVGPAAVPADPRASFDFPFQDVMISDPNPVTVTIETRNVPTSWTVTLRVVPRTGQDFIVDAVHVSGGFSQSTWEATVTLPNGTSVMQVRAAQ